MEKAIIKECPGIGCGVANIGWENDRGQGSHDKLPCGVSMVVSLQKWLGGAALRVRALYSRCLRDGDCWVIFGLTAVLFYGPAPAEEAKPKEPGRNPHGDPTLCGSCHRSVVEGRRALRFDGNTSRLCQSCHEGRLAKLEVHPVDRKPSEAILRRMPSGFPLTDGRLTCLTCHDLTWGCTTQPPAAMPSRNSLRGDRVASPSEFCFYCHVKESYNSFNVHDQLKTGEAKTDVCLWCHTNVPDVNSPDEAKVPYGLRGTSNAICRNCHRMMEDHPAGSPHVNEMPTSEMIWRMSAYEMQSKMRLSFAQLLEYARATRRSPRSMPLDENGRIACYTCHNPHEKGLFPPRNLRSVGSEPKHAANRRLRHYEGKICVACHQK